MIIEKAVIDDLEEIMKFYDMMCIELGKADFLPSGNKGGFPSEEMLKDSIFSVNLFITHLLEGTYLYEIFFTSF